MFETSANPTYEEAFAAAHRERAAAFRSLLAMFRLPRFARPARLRMA